MFAHLKKSVSPDLRKSEKSMTNDRQPGQGFTMKRRGSVLILREATYLEHIKEAKRSLKRSTILLNGLK